MTTTYIDPTASANGSGTLASPKNTWSGLDVSGPNSFLQKAGTQFNGHLGSILHGGASTTQPLILGAYDGNTGALITDGSKRALMNGAGLDTIITFDNAASFVTLDGLELFGSGLTDNQYQAAIIVYRFSGGRSHDVTVQNSFIHDTHGYTYAVRACCDNFKILHSIVDKTGDDNLHLDGGSNAEFGWLTLSNPSMETAEGDCIQGSDQTAPALNGWVHDCKITHTNKGVKTGIILNYFTSDHSNFHGWTIENNDIQGFGGPGNWCIGLYVDNCIVRNNILRDGERGIDLIGHDNLFQSNTILQSQSFTNARGVCDQGVNNKVIGNTITNTSGITKNGTQGIQSVASGLYQDNIISGWTNALTGSGKLTTTTPPPPILNTAALDAALAAAASNIATAQAEVLKLKS